MWTFLDLFQRFLHIEKSDTKNSCLEFVVTVKIFTE